MPGKLKIIQLRRKDGRQTDTSVGSSDGGAGVERGEGGGLLTSWDGTGFVPGDEVSACVYVCVSVCVRAYGLSPRSLPHLATFISLQTR